MERFSHSIGTKLPNSPIRPKPSPLKSERFMKELGLDDFSLSDLSSDNDVSDNEEMQKNRTGDIEFRVLQKELLSCTQQRDVLHDKNQSLQKIVVQLKSKFAKAEKDKKTKLKILRRAHEEAIKDKQSLLVDLQDILEENSEHHVLKLVSNIEKLHQEKTVLHEELIKAQDDYEIKLIKIEETFQSDAYSKTLGDGKAAELENLISAKVELEENLEKFKREHTFEKQQLETNIKTKQNEISQLRLKVEDLNNAICEMEETERNSKNSERSFISQGEKFQKKIDVLQNQININNLQNKKKSDAEEILLEKNVFLQNELTDLKSLLKKKSKDYKDKIDILTQQKLKLEKTNDMLETNMESSINDLTCQLKTQESTFEKRFNKQKEELGKAVYELENVQKETSVISQTQNTEIEKQISNNKDLKSKVSLLETKIEKEKMISDEKIQTVESELQRTNHLLQHQKELSFSSQSDLSLKMQKNEEELLNKVAQIELLLAKEKREAKINMKKSEESKSDLANKLEIQLKNVEELMQKLSNSNTKLENLNKNLNGANLNLKIKEEKLENHSTLLEKEKTQTLNLTEKVKSLENEIENLEQKIQTMIKVHSEDQNQQTDVIKTIKSSHKKEIDMLKLTSEKVNKTLNNKTSRLMKCLRVLYDSLKVISKEKRDLQREVRKLPLIIQSAISESKAKILNAVLELNDDAKNLMTRYQKEMRLRKKFLNQVLELKGNIRVFVRVRPQIKEDGLNCENVISYDDLDDSIIYVRNKQKGKTQTYEFDQVFKDTSTQQQVYDEVQALIISCMDGYEVCIFAYGQTGSGKTYTMEGIPENPGINQRALAELFKVIEERSIDWDYTVSVSLVEIYNESLKDLLRSSDQKLDIKMNADGTLFVQNLQSIPVNDSDAVNKVFRIGHKNRQTASTSMNEHSSRSHAVLTVTVSGINKTTGSKIMGKLNLIDLAGSERVSKSGASGDRLKEAQNINRSLSALGDVMHALKNKNSHVPFRNSKLTYLLQNSLSNDGKALMFVQVSPVQKNMSETICSLTFAERVKLVELGQAVKKTK